MSTVGREYVLDAVSIRQVHQAGISEIELLVGVLSEYRTDGLCVQFGEWKQLQRTGGYPLQQAIDGTRRVPQNVRCFRNDRPTRVESVRQLASLLNALDVIRVAMGEKGDDRTGINQNCLGDDTRILPGILDWCSGRQEPL
ncbi:MAG: hypothetical protein U0795_22840 [Pirellulales bacterium]